MTEYIDLTKHARLVIDNDPAPLNPRRDMNECITGCYTPPSWWGHPTEGPPALFDHPGNIVEADDRLYRTGRLEPESVVLRWSWMMHGIAMKRFGETYWYCDRNMFEHLHGGDFDRSIQEAVIDAEHEAYELWLRGEARLLTFQRKATFKRVTRRFHEKQEELLEVWEDIAAVGDVYLSTEYSVAWAALDNFYESMHRKERAIVSAMIDSERAL